MDPLLDPEAASPRRGADEDELRPVILANSQTIVSEITLEANQSLFRGPLYPSQSNPNNSDLETIHSHSSSSDQHSKPHTAEHDNISKAPSSTASISNKKPSRDNNHGTSTTSAAAKCYSPVRYRGQDGTLTCTATLLVYTPSVEAAEELVWPCSTISRHMIKSMPGQNKHMLRLVFHHGGEDPVILEVATREMVERIKADIGSARKRLAGGSKRKPPAAAEKPFAKKEDEASVQSVFSNTPKRKGPSSAAAKKPIEEASSTRQASKPRVNSESDTPSFLGMESGHAPERTRGTAGGDAAASEVSHGDNNLNAGPESARDNSREASASNNSNTHNSPGRNRRTTAPNNPSQSSSDQHTNRETTATSNSNTHNSPGRNRRTTASNHPNQSSSDQPNTNEASVPGAHSISGGATFDAAVIMKSLDSLEEMQESATRRHQQSATRGNNSNSRPTRTHNASHNSQNPNNSSSRRQRNRRRAASPHRAASSSSPPPPPNRVASVPGAHSVTGGSASAASIAKALDTLEGVGQAESESDFMRSVVRERQGLPDPKESPSPRRTTSQGSSSAPVPRTGRRPRQRPRPRSNQALPTVPLRAVASQPNIAPPPTGVPRRSASDSLPLVDDEDYPDDLVLRAIQKERQHAQEVSSSSRKKKPPPHAQVQSEQDAPVSRHGKRLPEQDDPEQPEVTRNRQRLPEQYAQDQAQQPSRRNRNTRQAPREAGNPGNTEEFIASIETSPLPAAQAPPASQPGATPIRGFDASEHASDRTITIGGGPQDLQAGDDLEQQQPRSPSDATVTPDLEVLIEAHVVEDTSASYERDGVIQAKPMAEREAIGCREICKSPTGRMAFVILALVMVIIMMAVILFLVLGPVNDKEDNGNDFVPLGLTRRPTRAPLDRPTPAPTLAPGQPTREPSTPLPGASELFDQQYSGLLLDSTYVAMEDPSTPQSQAREWLLTDPGLGDYRRHRRIQRFTLATFYFATQGDQWINNFNWLSLDIECQWQYITCSGAGQLHQISIGRNNLQGSLVPELGLLRSMQILELTDNPGMQGTVPATLGLLTNLNVLNIRPSELEGPLPLQIGDMASLESIMLSNSPQLDGSIPSEIGRLTNLKSLILNANSLSGNIPKEIGGLTLLGELDLAQNALEGTVPDEFGSLAYLERLYLQENEIGGTLSPDLGGMTLLVTADLSFTNIEGVVPFCNGGDTDVNLDGTQASCP